MTQVPHFEATTLDGSRVTYRQIWQNRNLLFACLAGQPDEDVERYLAALEAHRDELGLLETTAVTTRECIGGLPCPGVAIADRWGEIVHTTDGAAGAVPPVDDLLEWLRYIQHRCPECEGEAR